MDITINNYLPEWMQILKEFKEKYNLKIEIQISKKFKFCASAKFKDEKDSFIITIDEGVFRLIYEFYHSTFNENNPQLVQMASYSLQTKEEYKYEEEFGKTLADLYVYLSLKFIFFHELGHIMNGHIGYYNSINSNKIFGLNLNEDNLKDFNGLSAHEYQMLEINADAFAATNIMNGLVYGFNTNEVTYLDYYRKIIPTLTHLTLFAITSNIISMSLQGLGVSRVKTNLSQSKYIPKRARLNEIIGVYIRFYNYLNVEKDKVDLALFSELIPAYENSVNQYLIQKTYYSLDDFDENNKNAHELGEDVNNHLAHLYENVWPQLKSKLVAFTYLDEEDLG